MDYTKPIIVEGRQITADNMQDLLTDGNTALRPLYYFLCEWFSSSPTIRVQTSGSTGIPKIMEVEKESMIHSAQMTCDFLNLKESDTALLCMSLDYIGAKMMVVRAWLNGMNLLVCEASGHPLVTINQPINFAAMIPLQIYNSLSIASEKEKLISISTLIIGGSHINSQLEKELSNFPNPVYSTYGMTETLSHIALRRINGENKSDRYFPLPGITTGLSAHDTLLIHAPLLLPEPIITNDIACIHEDGSFLILGRADNIINSGGIKIQIEELEETIRNILNIPLVITYQDDDKMGQQIVMLTESIEAPQLLLDNLKSRLNPYHIPRKILHVEKIPLTTNHKIDRKSCREIVKYINK